jgi:hypothetical protein
LYALLGLKQEIAEKGQLQVLRYQSMALLHLEEDLTTMQA